SISAGVVASAPHDRSPAPGPAAPARSRLRLTETVAPPPPHAKPAAARASCTSVACRPGWRARNLHPCGFGARGAVDADGRAHSGGVEDHARQLVLVLVEVEHLGVRQGGEAGGDVVVGGALELDRADEVADPPRV